LLDNQRWIAAANSFGPTGARAPQRERDEFGQGRAERRWRRLIWHASPVSAAALRRVEIAIRDGYLRNDKDRKARPTKLIIDDPCSDFR